MKLILSSCDFRDVFSKKVILDNLPNSIEDCRVLFIPNEKATPEIIKTDLYPERLASFGFCKENIVVFNHADAESFKGLDIDVIYVSGGNTFGTLDKIRKSSFDQAIIDYVKSGATFIGGSAGAHIVTKSIEHVKRYDENNTDLKDFSGLGLFNGVLICHYTPERREHLNELEKQGKYKIQHLTDSDTLVVTDSEIILSTQYGTFAEEYKG